MRREERFYSIEWRCDRCGHTFRNGPQIATPPEWGRLNLYRTMTGGGERPELVDKDLCPGCAHDLTVWMGQA